MNTNPVSPNIQRTAGEKIFFEIPGIPARRDYLKNLKQVLIGNEKALVEALAVDLGKGDFEAHTNEVALINHEIDLALRSIRRWTRIRRPLLELFAQPGAARIDRVPFGDILIIAPWNFPIMLALAPLVSALTAGNRVVIKPSEMAPASAQILETVIKEAFPDGWVRVVQGGPVETRKLMESGFDMVFFTGSSRVGSIIMKQAAESLTPVVLELGGKNPAIVAEDASLRQTVRQIAWGKFNNAGQACVAPDHVYVPRAMKDRFTEEMSKTISEFFGVSPEDSHEYGRIISEGHLNRLRGFIESNEVLYGGECNPENLYIAPTLLASPDPASPVMQEEIFGPILPVIPYDSLDEVLNMLNSRPASLARYVFTGSRKTAEKVMAGNRYGGGMVNGTTLHFATSKLPFGGAGNSGMGAGHGKTGFEAFSRPRSVISRPYRLDLPLAYPGNHLPLNLIRFLMGR